MGYTRIIMDLHSCTKMKNSIYVLGGVTFVCSLLIYIYATEHSSGTLVFDNATELNKYNIQYRSMHGERKSNIAFLKLTKVGSTTLATMFLRYGVNNNLTTFPLRPCRIDGKVQQYLRKQNITVNIFASHTLYNYPFFTNIVKNPAIISLLRHPESRIISHAVFFLRNKPELKHLSTQDFVNEVAKNSEKYRAHNRMSALSGILNRAANEKNTEIGDFLKEYDREFDLVLVSERFDESLVLMKRLFHWTVRDILYRKKNTRPSSTADLKLDNSSRKIFQQINKIDYDMYNFFFNKLDKLITEAGEDLQEEVRHFKVVLKQMDQFCTHETHETTIFPPSKWDSYFILSRHDCYLIYTRNWSKWRRFHECCNSTKQNVTA